MSNPTVVMEPDDSSVIVARLQVVIGLLITDKPRVWGWLDELANAMADANMEYLKLYRKNYEMLGAVYDWLETSEYIPVLGKRVLVLRTGAVQEVMARMEIHASTGQWAWYCPSSGYWHDPSLVTHWRELPNPPELSVRNIA